MHNQYAWSNVAVPFLRLLDQVLEDAGVASEASGRYAEEMGRMGVRIAHAFRAWLRSRSLRMLPTEAARGRHDPEQDLLRLRLGGYVPAYAQEYSMEITQADQWLLQGVANALVARRRDGMGRHLHSPAPGAATSSSGAKAAQERRIREDTPTDSAQWGRGHEQPAAEAPHAAEDEGNCRGAARISGREHAEEENIACGLLGSAVSAQLDFPHAGSHVL